MHRTLRTSGGLAGKEYDAVLAYCYVRATNAPTGSICHRVAGQAFWEELTGDSAFYLKILAAMGDYPASHRRQYDAERARLVNRLELDFLLNFSLNDGSVDWPKLLEFNSSKGRPKPLQRRRTLPGAESSVLETVAVEESELMDEAAEIEE